MHFFSENSEQNFFQKIRHLVTTDTLLTEKQGHSTQALPLSVLPVLMYLVTVDSPPMHTTNQRWLEVTVL